MNKISSFQFLSSPDFRPLTSRLIHKKRCVDFSCFLQQKRRIKALTPPHSLMSAVRGQHCRRFGERATRMRLRRLALLATLLLSGGALPGRAPAAMAERPPQVAAGGFHSLLLNRDGTVLAWGNNAYGQLGNAPTRVTTMWPFRHSAIPIPVIGNDDLPLADVTRISAGRHFSLALKTDGTVWSWGSNAFGQLGDGSEEPDASQAREFTRQSAVPVPVQCRDEKRTLTDVIAIAAGDQHAVALLRDGTVRTWGNNYSGQLGDGTNVNTSAATTVRDANGDGPLSDIIAIAAGADHTLALTRHGTLWSWGANHSGQLGDGTTTHRRLPVRVVGLDGSGALPGIRAIAAGLAGTFALLGDGTIWAWGNNTLGQLGDGTRDNRAIPAQVRSAVGRGPLSGVAQIVAGGGHAAARLHDGRAMVWGVNDGGLRGDGTVAGSLLPVAVKGPDGTFDMQSVVDLAAGARHLLALQANGRLLAWGVNHNGQLGNAATTSGRFPAPVRMLFDPPQVAHGEGRWQQCTTAAIARRPGVGVPVEGQAFDTALRHTVSVPPEVDGLAHRERLTALAPFEEATLLTFSPVSDGTLTIAFDVRVSSPDSRTLDMSLLPAPGQDWSWREAWFVVWGRTPGKLSALSMDLADIDDEWHQVEIITDLEARTLRLQLNGRQVGEPMGFRYGTGHLPAETVFDRLRIGITHDNRLITGDSSVVDGEYADIANVRIVIVEDVPSRAHP